MRLLLVSGADTNERCEHDLAPLLLACCGGSVEAVRHLVEGGAYVNAADGEGETPLIAAAAVSETIVRYLLDKKARVNAEKTTAALL